LDLAVLEQDLKVEASEHRVFTHIHFNDGRQSGGMSGNWIWL
jgi:hypothetical protein